MTIESAIQKIVDPNYVFEEVSGVSVLKEGLILNPFAKNALTKKSMFLKNGLVVKYEYICPVPDEFSADGIGYEGARSAIYLTSRQCVMLSLK
jgi:hypothetical protein